ncbi:ABC transporter ATP-binding protein [Nocardioides campestrisoli]|uniref:ABC transporter ATP-binding protein n=1 Tax=Nocardioides campestrisoli TaxID=2736757 RepID=UPI0015E6804C|nr:ATP-binding cassette domain-containing protein [Nocardioides campestrisoli]
MIRVEELSFGYRAGGDRVFEGLTHSFPSGAITAVTGPSGGGKSTLLYLLALMLRAREGVIFYGDREVTSLSDADRTQVRSASVGFVFQDAMLDLSRSVLDNVLEGALYAGITRTDAATRAYGLLERMEVSHRADHRPGEISGGQAQRVAVCRALVKQPPVIIGDEPTGNLDADTTEVVWQAFIDAAAQGATVIVATHDDALAERADARLTVGA